MNKEEGEEEYYILTKDEIRSLWRILSHHYISYEDVEALEVVRKIRKIIDELA